MFPHSRLAVLPGPAGPRRFLTTGSCFSLMLFGSVYGAETHPDGTQSGYTRTPALEGADGVTADLSTDDQHLDPILRPPLLDGTLKPWFDAKRRWNDDYGLQLQFSLQALYQSASTTLTGIDEAAAARAQVQGMWTLIDRGGDNPGSLSFRIEDRFRITEDIPPTRLGGQFGSASTTGLGFSDFDLAVTEVAWRQTLMDGNLRLGFGKISAISWYNGHALSSAMRGFQQAALQSSNTKGAPGRGIGLVAGARLGEHFVILGGIHDANGVTTDDPFETIGDKEFFYSLEARWYPTTFERRMWDQVRLQIWYQDARSRAGVPSGYGATFAASKLYGDFLMPFVVAGVSDGDVATMQADATVGIAFAFDTTHRAARDVLGIGINWGNPANNTQQDQYSSELFYRFQLFKNVAITPSVQYILNPAANTNKGSVWLVGARVRTTF